MPSAAARFAKRLAAQFDAQCWTGLIVRLLPAGTRDDDRVVAPAHFLGAAWAPAAAGPARWPEAVVIGAPDADAALAELMRHVPAAARLYLADRDAVDAALAAEILQGSDRNLEPYQRAALAAFIAAERARVTAAIATRYSDRDPAFERFRTRIVDRG